jgi:prephenate dehydrogenase
MRPPIVAIVGLGQIGSSFAAALTRRKIARVVGVTRRLSTARRARRMGILSAASTDLSTLEGSEIVVLATPVRTLLRQIPELLPLVRPGTIFTDVGSTKKEILEAMRREKPQAVAIGGHPMAGNERAGLDGCDADLFEGRPWTLIPARPSDRRGALPLVRLVKGVGARPVWMDDPREHDLAVARISHLPYLLAYALMGTHESALRVGGNSFRDATRVAASDVEMVLDFLLTNRGPIQKAARELAARMGDLVARIGRKDVTGLQKLLRTAHARRATQ